MGANTRRHDRKQRLARQRESEIKAVTSRALKRFRLGVDFATPEQVTNALEKYVIDLRAVQEELMAKYPQADKELWRIRVEISCAIEAIAWERVQQVKPQ